MAEYQGETTSQALKPLVAVCVVLIVLDTIFFLLRLFARLWVKPVPFGWDDLLLVIAYLVNICACALGLGLSTSSE